MKLKMMIKLKVTIELKNNDTFQNDYNNKKTMKLK